MDYLGLKDTKRKWRPISQTLGDWAGSITISLEGVGLFVTASEKKWNKSKYIIGEFLSYFDSSTDRSYFLLKGMGQKNNLTMNFATACPLIMPLLIGLYMTMDLWRSGLDQDGWIISERAYNKYLNAGLE